MTANDSDSDLIAALAHSGIEDSLRYNMRFKREKRVYMATKKKAPRTDRLPGMEDAAIKELETLAEELSEVRAERIKLSKREGELQDDLLKVMKKHKRIEYHHEDVHAWREIADEKVKVKIGELTSKKAKQVADAVAEVRQHEETTDTPQGDQQAQVH